MSNPANWTDEKVELLKKLWAGRDFSTSQIAMMLGGLNSNQVIGKAHRLGLEARRKPHANGSTRTKQRRPPRRKASRIMASVFTPMIPDDQPRKRHKTIEPAPASAQRRTIETLDDLPEAPRYCRWPHGDPQDKEFFFCGAKTIEGLPYCGHHSERAYAPAADRRRERRVG